MKPAAFDGRNREPATTRKFQRTGWILLILLAAAALRLVNLAGAPPGMTHDEADHGLTAWEIVNGARDIYFTVGYGREPLYDYATALVMAGTGPTIYAARLTSVYFSLLMIAAVYAWSRRAFGRPVALLTAAGLAVGFWPVMAGRQALRSITLPAIFSLAALFFWIGAQRGGEQRSGRAKEHPISSAPLLPTSPSTFLPFALAGVFLGLTTYTYIPARVMWLAFPALVAYLILAAPPGRRHIGRPLAGLGLTLIIAALVAAPLFFHLANNPGLEVRIDELSAPLRLAADSDLSPLWFNVRGALRLFTIEGDQTWRYNIPGKPFLGPLMGVLFYAGLLVALWAAVRGLGGRGAEEQRSGGTGAFFALAWLALGFAPVLITGPGLSMTQAIGMLPVLYLFPALALVRGHGLITNDERRLLSSDELTNKESGGNRSSTSDSSFIISSDDRSRHSSLVTQLGGLIAVALFATWGILTARDYFGRWANEPQVRVQYETTMVTALHYLDERGGGAAAVSTITPGRFHTPAVALLTLRNPAVSPRWFDGRQSLLFPAEEDSLLVVPGFTPIPTELRGYLSDATLIDELPLRPDDLDRPVQIYAAGGSPATVGQMSDGRQPVQFGEHVELLGYDLSAAQALPGDTLALVTAWRLNQPLPDASLFAHLLGPAGPLAVADSLGAPGESWISGDILLQLHRIVVPPGTPAGSYPLAVGVYTQDDGRRLPAERGGDMVTLTTVAVGNE